MHAYRSSRRGVIAVVLVSTVMVAGASADWERLPDPSLSFQAGRITIMDDVAWTILGTGFCEPFMVFDGERTIYIGHPGITDAASVDTYNDWIAYDVEQQTYRTLNSPADDWTPTHFCLTSSATGAYVDGGIIVSSNLAGQNLVYDIEHDKWVLATPSLPNVLGRQAFTADADHEVLYWLEAPGDVGSIDPEVGMDSVDLQQAAYLYRDRVGLSVRDNQVYWAGGFYAETGYYKMWNYMYFGKSSPLAYVYNRIEHRLDILPPIPHKAAMAGSAWGLDGLHFVGKELTADPIALYVPIFIQYYVYFVETYHFVYHPAVNAWETVADLPAGCLPLAVVGAQGWLHGLFACTDPDPNQLAMFRTYIGTTSSTTAVTTTTTTTSTEDGPDDDLDDDDDDDEDDDGHDDDESDDDASGAAKDDDTADAIGDDDDDGWGC